MRDTDLADAVRYGIVLASGKPAIRDDRRVVPVHASDDQCHAILLPMVAVLILAIKLLQSLTGAVQASRDVRMIRYP